METSNDTNRLLDPLVAVHPHAAAGEVGDADVVAGVEVENVAVAIDGHEAAESNRRTRLSANPGHPSKPSRLSSIP